MKTLYSNDDTMKDDWFCLVKFNGGEVVPTGERQNPKMRMLKGEYAIKYQRNRSGASVSYIKITENQATKIINSKDKEEKIKELTKATIRCIPLDNKPEAGKCILTGNPSDQRVLFARAY